MLVEQIIRTVVDSEVLIDALALDVGVVSVEVNHRMPKTLYRDTVAAKRTRATPVCRLQSLKVRPIQYDGLQFVPYALKEHLNPAMQDFF